VIRFLNIVANRPSSGEQSRFLLLHNPSSSPVLAGYAPNMTEKSEDMGAVTHQLSVVDDDMNKYATVKEANVASVALSKSSIRKMCT
jgi:hypothetical protein